MWWTLCSFLDVFFLYMCVCAYVRMYVGVCVFACPSNLPTIMAAIFPPSMGAKSFWEFSTKGGNKDSTLYESEPKRGSKPPFIRIGTSGWSENRTFTSLPRIIGHLHPYLCLNRIMERQFEDSFFMFYARLKILDDHAGREVLPCGETSALPLMCLHAYVHMYVGMCVCMHV